MLKVVQVSGVACEPNEGDLEEWSSVGQVEMGMLQREDFILFEIISCCDVRVV